MQITISDRSGPEREADAKALAAEHGFEWVPRKLRDRAVPHLVLGRELTLHNGSERLRWHPGLLHAIRDAGLNHPWARLSGVEKGDTVLDCTCGMGVDSVYFAELTGRTVVAYEANLPVSLITRAGLRRVGADVEVRFGSSVEALRTMPDDSFDIVIADPMFPRDAGQTTHSLDGLRGLGEAGGFGARWLADARRVARKAVVFKDCEGMPVMGSLAPEETYFRRGRLVVYGVWRS